MQLAMSGSVPDLKEVNCRMSGQPYFAVFSTNGTLLDFKMLKICPHSAIFSLRFFKFDSLQAAPGMLKSAIADLAKCTPR